MNQCSNRNSHQAGFNMLELMIVLAIISLLAALVGPTLYERMKPAKQSVARAQIENFVTALDSFYIDTGHFPSTQQGLSVLRDKPANEPKWRGPYLKKVVPGDPWGNAYVYRYPGRNGSYEIISYGSDGKEGGKDEAADINSWE